MDQRKCEHMNERVLDSNEHHPEQHISVHVTWRWWIQYVRTFFWRFTGWNDVIYICKIRVAHVYNHNVVLLPALPSCFAISFPGGNTLCRWWAWRIILVDEKIFPELSAVNQCAYDCSEAASWETNPIVSPQVGGKSLRSDNSQLLPTSRYQNIFRQHT